MLKLKQHSDSDSCAQTTSVWKETLIHSKKTLLTVQSSPSGQHNDMAEDFLMKRRKYAISKQPQLHSHVEESGWELWKLGGKLPHPMFSSGSLGIGADVAITDEERPGSNREKNHQLALRGWKSASWLTQGFYFLVGKAIAAPGTLPEVRLPSTKRTFPLLGHLDLFLRTPGIIQESTGHLQHQTSLWSSTLHGKYKSLTT